MAEADLNIVEVDDDSCLSPVACLKDRERMKELEQLEDCFILEFRQQDDDDLLNLSKLSFSNYSCNNSDDDDLQVVAEKGQVACRDYPHPRHTCAMFPFNKTPHDTHCEQCFCYVCDKAAPCTMWTGTNGHCHASEAEGEDWTYKRKEMMRISIMDCEAIY